MTKKASDTCPCGSGRPRQACCGGRSVPVRLVVTGVLIIAAVGGITAIGLSMTRDRSAATGPLATPLAARSVSGATPRPWEYDPVNNQHWHAGHGHWHPGPPPPEAERNSSAAVTPLTATSSLATGAATPLPWQYDAESNRHWHAEHGHWHDGPPPAGVSSPNYTPPAGATPAPAPGDSDDPG